MDGSPGFVALHPGYSLLSPEADREVCGLRRFQRLHHCKPRPFDLEPELAILFPEGAGRELTRFFGVGEIFFHDAHQKKNPAGAGLQSFPKSES